MIFGLVLLTDMNIRQKIYLATGLALIIVILLFWGVVKPLLLEIQITSTSVKERNEKLLILTRTNQDYLKQLESDYNDIKEDISLIKSGFLDVDKVVDFFIYLENIAFNTSNELEIEAKDFPVFTLYLLGDFPNLMKFLGWLENSKYFVDLDLIQIKRFAEKGLSLEEEAVSIGNIKTTLKIKTYIKNANFYEKGEIFKTD